MIRENIQTFYIFFRVEHIYTHLIFVVSWAFEIYGT